MNMEENNRSAIADILYGSYIRYDRLYSMTEFAFYGKKIDSNVNIFIDIYSILRSLYKRGLNFDILESCVIASCFINMAIHLRGYFESRHRTPTRIYLIYGGARPIETMCRYPGYNSKNILMEDSNAYLQNLIKDNMEIISILCPYLYDIFYVIDWDKEFSTIAGSIIDSNNTAEPNIIYSKDPMSYQLVAFEPYTFLYRPKKRFSEETSFVVTKSTLYNAYRYGELGITKKVDTFLHPGLFSMYLAIAGVKTRSLNSIRNANTTIKILEQAVNNQILINGYNSSWHFQNPFEKIFENSKVDISDVCNRVDILDFPTNKELYKLTPIYIEMINSVHQNLYDPQEVRNINDKYFQKYPLDLNRV